MKYARLVFEAEIEDGASEEDVCDAIEKRMIAFIQECWGISDLELHNKPYPEYDRIRFPLSDNASKKLLHPEDCDCGQCTGEDRALEAMERGIVETERARVGDD